jgi:hypothetical protein
MRIEVKPVDVELDNAMLAAIYREAVKDMLVSVHYRRGRVFLDITLFCDTGFGKPRDVTRSYALSPLLSGQEINEWIEDPKENARAWDTLHRIAKKFCALSAPAAEKKKKV